MLKETVLKRIFKESKRWIYLNGGFGGGGATNIIEDIREGSSEITHGCGGGYTGGGYSYEKNDGCTGGGGGSYSIDRTGAKRIGHQSTGKCVVTCIGE